MFPDTECLEVSRMIEPNKEGSKISLLIADVDGTLVNEDKVLTPRAKAAVKALGVAGIALTITSGRPPRGMAMLIGPLALRTPAAGFNGRVFVNPDMTVLEERVPRRHPFGRQQREGGSPRYRSIYPFPARRSQRSATCQMMCRCSTKAVSASPWAMRVRMFRRRRGSSPPPTRMRASPRR